MCFSHNKEHQSGFYVHHERYQKDNEHQIQDVHQQGRGRDKHREEERRSVPARSRVRTKNLQQLWQESSKLEGSISKVTKNLP